MSRARKWCWSLCLVTAAALSACGGGGGNEKKPPPKEGPSAVEKQWQLAVLSEAAVAVIPGGGYGLDTPNALAADWLDFNSGTGLLDARQATYTNDTWQVRGASGMTGLPQGLTYAPFHVARAGDWSVVQSRIGNTLYARFDGPGGVSSGYVPVSLVSNSIAWAAVGATGVARLYWSDSSAPGSVVTRTGHFTGATWTDDGVVPDMSTAMAMSLSGVAAGPDGKGWLFYEAAAGFADDGHYARYVDATSGLGATYRLDDPALGRAESGRKAVAESSTAITTIGLQSGPTGQCLAARRFKVGAWGGTQCVNGSPSVSSIGSLYELAVEPDGRAVVAWSDAGGRLYANVRGLDGGWSGTRLLVIPEGSISSLHPQIDRSGAAVVVYRDASAGQPTRLNAVLFDAGTGAWSGIERVDNTEASAYIRVAVSYNSRGEPGVLSFSSLGGQYEVHVSTRLNGAWETTATLADFPTSPTFPYGVVSIQRLVPFGDGGWTAFWEVNSPVGGGTRRLMTATYR